MKPTDRVRSLANAVLGAPDIDPDETHRMLAGQDVDP